MNSINLAFILIESKRSQHYDNVGQYIILLTNLFINLFYDY